MTLCVSDDIKDDKILRSVVLLVSVGVVNVLIASQISTQHAFHDVTVLQNVSTVHADADISVGAD